MKIIRKSTFETNSSSCHSLTLNQNCKDSKIKQVLAKYNAPVLCLGEYHWESERYDTFLTKLEYVITSLISSGRTGSLQDLLQTMLDYGVEDFAINGLILSEYDSLEDYIEALEKLDVSLDHQSRDLLYALDTNELLKLVCSDLSYIKTGNDNSLEDPYFPEYVIQSVKDEVGEETWKEWKERCETSTWCGNSDSDIIAENTDKVLRFNGKIEE